MIIYFTPNGYLHMKSQEEALVVPAIPVVPTMMICHFWLCR
jgi:hypothetical protein